MLQVGHSKSPNSSSVTGALGLPRRCGGWAPAGDRSVEVFVELLRDRKTTQVAAKAASRTTTIIINGRKRFIGISTDDNGTLALFNRVVNCFVERVVNIHFQSVLTFWPLTRPG